MIRVSVHLISANDGAITELARMDIANDGGNPNSCRQDYDGVSYIGRDKARLDKCTPSKKGRVENWESERFHVWNLVRAMLQALGYTQGRAQHAQGIVDGETITCVPSYEELKERLSYMEAKYGAVQWNAPK